MTAEEYRDYKEHLRRIDAGGNDGADIYDFDVFCEVLVEKYNKPIKEQLLEFEREL